MSDTSPTDPMAETFEAQRDRLRAVAYRMLGSHADAEDVVQEAWLRLSRQDAATIHNLAGWLTTVVGRISLDVLRSRQARPEASYDGRLSELVVTPDDGPVPEDDAVLADSVGLALLVVLDSLGPSERLAFVLHDLFAVPFEEIGQILGKSTAATKMLASRARRKVQTIERPTGLGREQREVVQAFLAAARHGDFEELLRAALVDGLPGIISWREDGTPLSVLAFTVADGRITDISVVTDPAKLALMDLPEPA
jgi:RNA polymerase sigma factor (sigma-70 family)